MTLAASSLHPTPAPEISQIEHWWQWSSPLQLYHKML